MQINKCRSCLRMLFISLVTAFALTSCINEDMSKCVTYTHKFTVKALDANNVELDKTQVTEVILSIFDKDKGFLESRNAVVGQSIELNYPQSDKIIIVAWGNYLQGDQTMPIIGKGDLMDLLYVSLIRINRAEVVRVKSPGDLFYGYLEMTINKKATKANLFMQRKVASIAITARTLKEFAGTVEQDFSYELRANTSEKLNYYGMPVGRDACYLPDAIFDEKEDFVTPTFNIFPTLGTIEVDIFFKNRLLKTITTDAQGRPLRPQEGRLLNILIDFRANVTVSVSVTPWGEKQIWKEFN